jgi:hypothetical protein
MTSTQHVPELAPVVPDELLAEFAENAGVCPRPVLREVTDNDTGETELVPIRCGSTRERVCPPCAARARRLRMQQCRDGWHRTDDPADLEDDQDDDQGDHDEPHDEGDDAESKSGRRRSTKRRPEFPPLPPKVDPENRDRPWADGS